MIGLGVATVASAGVGNMLGRGDGKTAKKYALGAIFNIWLITIPIAAILIALRNE